ncbi:stage II sporulation protein M [Staphylococcus warneri]|uniref:stage II sporulation protein M n=1 Tax=Staphylococcus warneri TaxID=1292 RepID=UPI0022E5A8F5|nr:stage II sporulation protein M [Staphylococcus warneri]
MLNISDKQYVQRAMKWFVFSLIILIISFILSSIFSPSLDTFKNMGDQIPSSLDKATGLNKVWEFIINNGFRVSLQMLILSLIPIPFLYCVNLISTNTITGIMFGFVINFDFHKGLIIIVSSIPHIIVEILAMCFVVSSLYKLNQAIVRKISNFFRKEKKQKYSVKQALIQLIKTYLFIALPLYIIAAFLETYFTEWIYNILI